MNKKELINQLISAVVYIVIGVILALNPGMSINILCTGSGICALAYGAFTILFYFLRRHDDDISRFTLPVGIAFAALGAFCLIAPAVVVSVIPLIFGIVLLIDGAGKIGRALELRRSGFVRWSVVAMVGALIMLFGILLVTQPYMAVETVVSLFGSLLAADGLIDVYFMFRIYKLSK